MQATRERAYPPNETDEQSLYLRSGVTLRRLSGAYISVAADAYWIRAIQYYGGTKRRLTEQRQGPEPPPLITALPVENFGLLYPLLDITTTLDPRLNIAYRFGAVFLAEPSLGGPGRPDLAIALLEKGLRVRPDKWEYLQDIGFVYYWYVHGLRRCRGAVSTGQRGAWRAVVAAVAGRHDARAGRRPAIVARDVGIDPAVSGQ